MAAPVACAECGQPFLDAGARDRHELRAHGDDPPDSTVSDDVLETVEAALDAYFAERDLSTTTRARYLVAETGIDLGTDLVGQALAELASGRGERYVAEALNPDNNTIMWEVRRR